MRRVSCAAGAGAATLRTPSAAAHAARLDEARLDEADNRAVTHRISTNEDAIARTVRCARVAPIACAPSGDGRASVDAARVRALADARLADAQLADAVCDDVSSMAGDVVDGGGSASRRRGGADSRGLEAASDGADREEEGDAPKNESARRAHIARAQRNPAERIVILDVRNKPELAHGMLPLSVHVPRMRERAGEDVGAR